MITRLRIRSLFALLVVCSLPSGVVAQVVVDLVPYLGLYVPMASLPGGVLKQDLSEALGTRVTVWLGDRLGIEGTMNYAPSSDVTRTQANCGFANCSFPGPRGANITATSVKAIVRLSPPGNAMTLHVGGGVGSVGYDGEAYGGSQFIGGGHGVTSDVAWIMNAGAVFRLGPRIALRLDAENYLFGINFPCRCCPSYGVCWGVSSGDGSRSARQADLVCSLGLAVRLAGP
jgi:hypothetical protein